MPIKLIAIDGPGGVGKTTVSRRLAENLGYYFLSSGMIYRAMAWYMAQRKEGPAPDAESEPQADSRPRTQAAQPPDLTLLEDFALRIDGAGGLWVNGASVSGALHTEEISRAASLISVFPEVRARADQVQRDTVRRIEEEGSYPGVILEGRDIGTVVFPSATHKFFLTAGEEVRAERRFREKQAEDPTLTREAVQTALRERDERDETRDVAPLKPADDAEVVDTSTLSLEQVVALMLEKTGAAAGR